MQASAIAVARINNGQVEKRLQGATSGIADLDGQLEAMASLLDEAGYSGLIGALLHSLETN